MKKIYLKPGKETALKNRHPWVFSGAIARWPQEMEDGEILTVFSYDDRLLGSGYFRRGSSLAGRMVAFGADAPLEKMKGHLLTAKRMRERLLDSSQTTGYRWINGEGDGIPGLTVDCYGDYLVIQSGTLGVDRLIPWFVEELRALKPACRGIYEKSLSLSRHQEGLKPREGILWGSLGQSIDILEYGIRFSVDIVKGQKTGFFLDQREMRKLIRELSLEKRVLNTFSYTGGFSLAAAAGGALAVDSLDISQEALDLVEKNYHLNGFSFDKSHVIQMDAFQFLRESPLQYDLVILDPPAFAKKRGDTIQACRGYKEINRQAISKMPSGSLLLTCSCSYPIDDKLFQQVVFQAAVEAQREVKILSHHHQAWDHPVNIYHPEGRYLKSLLLAVE